MKQFLAVVLAMTLLVPAVAQAADKPAKPEASAPAPAMPGMTRPMCGMMPGKGLMPMHPGMGMGMGPERWWRIGAMSMQLCEILKEANGLLATGKLTPDGQKQMGQVMSQLCGLVPEMFYPGGMERPADMMQKLKEMEAVLEKLEAQSRGK